MWNKAQFFKNITLILGYILISNNYVVAQADDQLLQVATEMYQFGDKRDALDVFKQAIEMNPLNARANYMAGKAIIETINKEQSLAYFLKAYKINPDISPDILFMIGHAYHLGYKLDDAVEYYNQHLKSVPISSFSEDGKIAEIVKTERKIYECSVAKTIMQRPLKATIENLGPLVNSVDEDYAPVISSDQSTMYFTSRRKGSTGNNKDNDNEFFEDIFVTYNKEGKWSEPKNIGTVVNTELHESAIGLSPDGKQLYIYIDNNKHKGDIFYSTLDKAGAWSVPVAMDNSINTEYIENAITFTADGKTIYFSSNKPGGKGGMDLYSSTLNKNNKWTVPVNLGEIVNTDTDDEAPYIAADGISLYFASKGHEGMGGYDIFKTVLDTNTKQWSIPANMQYPINSTDDDMYFSISSDSKYAYFSSVKVDGIGDVDIFKITIDETFMSELASADSITKKKIANIDPIEPTPALASKESNGKQTDSNPKNSKTNNSIDEAKNILHSTIHMSVVDKKTKKPLDSKIEIRTESGKNNMVRGDVKQGEFNYTFANKTRTRYIITIEKEGYLFKSSNVWVEAPSEDNAPLNYTFELEYIEVGAKCVMRNIFFEYDKFTLSEKSDSELLKLYVMMKENKTMKIEIDGHTDNSGNHLYNKTLSHKRAESVVQWLVTKGIDQSRFMAKGYGDEMPLASNDDEEEGRELNRRTEFVIIKK